MAATSVWRHASLFSLTPLPHSSASLFSLTLQCHALSLSLYLDFVFLRSLAGTTPPTVVKTHPKSSYWLIAAQNIFTKKTLMGKIQSKHQHPHFLSLHVCNLTCYIL